jgi:NitT/TauT family transport system permease protein
MFQKLTEVIAEQQKALAKQEKFEMDFSKLFELRGKLDKNTNSIIAVIGFALLMTLWITITSLHMVKPQILPSPFKVLLAFPELHFQNALVRNLGFSIYLNIMGYIEAVAISLIVGFIMGMFPLFKSLFSAYVNSARFVPLTALVGLFIAWCGIEVNMKIQFLAVGIMVYLIPVVIARIEEIDEVYEHTAKMLGATPVQRVLYVYIPSVIGRIIVDIQNLLAISWTYLIVAEMVNSSAGGIGSLAFLSARQSRVDKVFAVLLIIALVGFLQDRLFSFIDRKICKYKYL